MKNYYVQLSKQSTTVKATNELEAAKKAIIEFMPIDAKESERRLQESDDFPTSLDVLKQDYKDSDMELRVKEVNLNFTDSEGNEKNNIVVDLANLNDTDISFIIINKINCTIKTTQDVTNTSKIEKGVYLPFSEPAFVSQPEIINQILAVYFTGNKTLKDVFNILFVLTFSNGGRVGVRNLEVDNDCEVIIKF